MISIKNLVKYYGNYKALDDISFDIENGHIYGFLGPNGAGKSTTMNIMTGCLSPTEGTVSIDGMDIFENAKDAKKKLGYLPEIPPLYTEQTPNEYLYFVARAKGIDKKDVNEAIDDVIKETGLEEVKNRLIKNLSKGYKQRVGIAQAILGNPSIIILDEPTVGLDPSQIIEIRNLIKKLGETHTVILSSHILSEVQSVCDKVLIISKGKLIAYDDTENLEKHLLGKAGLKVKTSGTYEKVESIMNKIPFASNVVITADNAVSDNPLINITLEAEQDKIDELSKAIFEAFIKEKLTIYELSPIKASLEDIFIELTKDDDEQVPDSNSGKEDE